jgi:Skp family chaperone for outer membrane proteins
MKHLVNVGRVVAFLGMTVAFSGIGFAQCKVAVVDIRATVIGSNDGKAQAAKFDVRVKEWTAKLDIIRREISNAQKQLNGQAARIPEDSDAVLNGRIQAKSSELARIQSDAQKDVDNYRDFLLGSVMKVAAETAEMVAAEKGIASVVDSSAPSTGPMPDAVGKDCDFTAEVKARMNAKYSVGAPVK